MGLVHRLPDGFGPYLRGLRISRGLSLRDAAGELGISFTRLQKMETGGRHRALELELLFRIAGFYVRPRAEVLRHAGIQGLEPLHHDLVVDDGAAAFAALVLAPELRPLRMDTAWLDSFSPLQKAQWVEFARRLANHPEPARRVEQLLAGVAP